MRNRTPYPCAVRNCVFCAWPGVQSSPGNWVGRAACTTCPQQLQRRMHANVMYNASRHHASACSNRYAKCTWGSQRVPHA
eukprot:1161531-Pelagomonas_calceolata.AAC.8